MRSQLIRRSRSLLKASITSRHPFILSDRPSRLLRKDQTTSRSLRTWKRLASSAKPPLAGDDDTSPAAVAFPPDPPSEDAEKSDAEKPKKRARVSKDSSSDPPQLPTGLDILWIPEVFDLGTKPSNALPPPEILEEALNNLHITQHPQTQHRASYPSPTGPQVEPTLALYCPIEGGEYIIDETVRELARRTGSEVVVIDSVQLAAGEWGHFGKAASAIQLSRNPLHFPHSPSSRSAQRAIMAEEEEEEPTQVSVPMTLHVLTSTRGRPILSSSSRGNSTQNKAKLFFDEIVNIPAPESPEGSVTDRSRIIYVRDFSTLAPSSSTWYPHLLSAVRQRRTNAISRTTPITKPTTIVFGITPSITPPSSPYPGASGQGLINLLMSRSTSSSMAAPGSKPGKADWGEDEASDKEREKRLRDRLRKWEKGDAALQDELPQLSATPDEVENNGKPKAGVVVIGGNGGMSGLPPFLESLGSRFGENRDEVSDSGDTRFFRTSVLVPNVRSLAEERNCRVARRREINELTMRMGVGAVGGKLVPRTESVIEPLIPGKETDGDGKGTAASKSIEEKMWDEWGKRIEVWTTVRQIADRAVGSMFASNSTRPKADKPEKFTLQPTDIPWVAVYRAWDAQRSSRDLRQAWLKESSGKFVHEHDEESDEVDGGEEESVDEVLERVKQDPELEQHEQRLLPCIVNSASMPTSFSHVHLPAHTIDAVRSIVALPLLHPTAFQQGILKEHGMTGCLLFGPPGTGKTLVVRALAKEAGCRMMVISPSDVMDMYVGEGEKMVKAVFSLARRLSPCVVFLDEIDALFGARMSARESGGAFAHRGVITEFMQEMDGLKSCKEDNVIVIGATNRPFDLDDAVLRRLPRRLLVDLPGEKEREEILKILLRDETLSPELDLKILAKKTDSFSGSDLKHLCVSAALDAVKERVDVPWKTSSSDANVPTTSESDLISTSSINTVPSAESLPTDDKVTLPLLEGESKSEPHTRTLLWRHFNKALKEITPSSSEALGSLADLRKWNDQFGEGRRNRRRQQVWGKDRFGFTNKTDEGQDEGRVVSIGGSSSSESDTTTVEK